MKYKYFLIYLSGVIGVYYFITRPPVLVIAPAVSNYGFDKAPIDCKITNRGIRPIKVVKPEFWINFMIDVVASNGKQIPYTGPIHSKIWTKDELILLNWGESYAFSVNLLQSGSAEVRFGSIKKEASKNASIEYKKLINRLEHNKRFNINTQGTYNVRAKYWVTRDLIKHFSPELITWWWRGEICSNTIAVSFIEKPSKPNKLPPE